MRYAARRDEVLAAVGTEAPLTPGNPARLPDPRGG